MIFVGFRSFNIQSNNTRVDVIVLFYRKQNFSHNFIYAVRKKNHCLRRKK